MTGERLDRVARIMDAFHERTLGSGGPSRRYLWTDAFAVCTCLALHRADDAGGWLDRAWALVRDVHRVLGRHRPDDHRTGWISGLDEAAGARRPTAGGLRIGKPLPERDAGVPLDERLEWERDGQYYHYLTRWMHALTRLAEETGDPEPVRWAVDLARAAHRGFVHEEAGGRRIHWKMSTDLSRPLVPSMGQHDPLDGLVTTAGVARAAAAADGAADGGGVLDRELRELWDMCRGRGWATGDALGIGGLLTAACMLARFAARLPDAAGDLLGRVLKDALRSLELVMLGRFIGGPAARRLAFRELGLSLGLAGAAWLRVAERDQGLPGGGDVAAALDGLAAFAPLRGRIERFWLDTANQTVETWTEHLDINAVMLATSLLPDGYLGVTP